MDPLWSVTPLRRRRLDKGWPQWLVARKAGVSVNKVSYAERGLDILTPADRRRLAATLGVEVRELFPEVTVQ
jgi:transcriptional regulator with XRE-family HTH domain